MRRVVIVGTSGSGKTTLARRLATALNAAHIELDALHWEPNWTETPTGRLREKVRSAIAAAGEGWTVCGNYRKVNDEIWPNADTIIWLDYSMSVVARRVFLRTMSRWWNRQELWSGNRERLTVQFFSRDSLFLWVINTWRIHRRDYPKELRSEKCRHLRVIRFRDPRAADAWIARLESSHAGDEQEQPNDSVAA
jgi:adenylate kinase family enzyme